MCGVAAMGNEFDKELGFRLRRLRQSRRMSQKVLGEILCVSFQQVQKYESGTNRMSPELLYRCSKIFEIPVGYFFGVEGGSLSTYDKRVMNIAAAIASVSSDEIVNKMYHLALAIGVKAQRETS